MIKQLETLTKEEEKVLKAIIKGYPLNTKSVLMLAKEIKTAPEWEGILDKYKQKLQIEEEFEKKIKKEMQYYSSPNETWTHKGHKSLSENIRKHDIHLNHSNPTKYLNDEEYKQYESAYKNEISMRQQSLENSRISLGTSSQFDIFNKFKENKDEITETLTEYMDQYFYPGNVIRYLSLLDKRFCDFHETCDYDRFKEGDDYTCGSIHNNIFLYSFLDIVDVKCLYICFHNGKNYISPLNDKAFHKFIQKKENLPYDDMMQTNDVLKKQHHEIIRTSLSHVLKRFEKIYSTTNRLEIPCQLYDIVIKHNMFHFDEEIDSTFEVELTGINNKHFVSSIINNANHSISIIKSNKKKYFNPSYGSGINETFRLYDYVPLFNQNYYIKKDSFANVNHEMHKVDANEYGNVGELFNSRFMFGLNKSIYAYTGDNLHFFSNRHQLRKNKIYKTISGGSNSVLYIPYNSKGFCWYSSIISSLFYADEMDVIMLKKSMRYVKKAIDTIKIFQSKLRSVNSQTLIKYSKYNKEKQELLNSMIFINIFVYTSYAVIMKNKISEVPFKEAWIECLNSILISGDILKEWNNKLLQITATTWKHRTINKKKIQ